MIRITGLDSLDVCFSTSRSLDGSDAMDPDPDYSTACAILRTDQPGLEGHGMTFTIGRGSRDLLPGDRGAVGSRGRAGAGLDPGAPGEMCQNRILFKQFIMRGAIDIVQLDSCRLGGVNEVLR